MVRTRSTASTPPNSQPPPTPPSKYKKLPPDTERALLEHLLSPFRFNKFSQTCKNHPLLYSDNPTIRKQIANRRTYLRTLSDPQLVQLLLCVDQGINQQILESEDDDQDSHHSSSAEESDHSEHQVRSPQPRTRNISQTIPAPYIPEELEEESPPYQVQPSPAHQRSSPQVRSKVRSSPQVHQRSPQVRSLPLEIMSSSSRRGAAPAIFGHEEDYELNFTHCERNPPGMFAFLTPNVTLQSQDVVDVVSVYMAVADPRDVMEIKGELLDDGSGILVSGPSVPSCFLKNVKEMHKLEELECYGEALARDHPGPLHTSDAADERPC